MRPNRTKTLLKNGRPVFGTLCTSASPLLAEALGHAGFDFLIVDLQHGENDLANLQGMLQAVSATPATPLVRIPANAPVYIQRALDLGAYGIVVPMVDCRADAEAVVRSVRYAPTGHRSWGPVRGSMYGGPDYFARAHEEILTLVMIETAGGLAHAQEILAVAGIDGCFIGPNDLSISLGFASELAELPQEVESAVASIVDAAHAHGKVAGMQTYTPSAARRRMAQGVRFVSIQSDLRMVRSTSSDLLALLKTEGDA